MTGKRVNIIYDGDCGFCVRSLKVLSALDVWGLLRFHKSQNAETFAQFPGLQDADVANAMYAVAGDEVPQRGFFAFRRVLWSSPLMWPLLLLFYLPGAGLVGTRIYAWVAQNRGRFGCESNTCALPTGGSSVQHFKE
jgi:acetyl esterase